MSRLRVLLAGDQKLVLAGLRLLLGTASDAEVVGEVSNESATIRFVEQNLPDVVFMDSDSSSFRALEVMRSLSDAGPKTRVIFLSTLADPARVQAALRAGAAGYLLTSADEQELQLAIQKVTQDETYLSPPISKDIDEKYGLSDTASLEVLSVRQKQVLTLIAEGKSNKQIAANLQISPKTVDSHRTKIMDRLNIHDLSGLVRFAIKVGLVSLEVGIAFSNLHSAIIILR